MTNIRPLVQTLCICLIISLGLLYVSLTGASPSFSGAFRNLIFVPFGLLCPLFACGCLLHDLCGRRRAGTARVLAAAGKILFGATGTLLVWMRLGAS